MARRCLKSGGMSVDHKMVETEARLFAVPLTQQIAAKANTKAPDEIGTFAGTCATLVAQTMLITLVIHHHEPGTAEGEKMLRSFYDSAVKDAVARWHKSDLKDHKKRGRL